MNNDLNLSQPVMGTNNPQSAQASLGASESKDFQQAAGTDILQQAKTIQVQNTGEPLPATQPPAKSVTSYLPLILVVIALVLISIRLIRWVMAAPSRTEEVEKPVEVTKPAASVSKAKSKKTSKNKKLTRAQRRRQQ